MNKKLLKIIKQSTPFDWVLYAPIMLMTVIIVVWISLLIIVVWTDLSWLLGCAFDTASPCVDPRTGIHYQYGDYGRLTPVPTP